LVKLRYISWAEYGKLSAELVERLRDESPRLDLVIGIARGGIPLAMVVSDQMDVRLDIINVKSYEGIAQRQKPRIVSTLTESVTKKRVLLVDDLVDEGSTMRTVTKHLRREGPKLLKTAVLFKKPWTKFGPDFYLETLEEWIVFPWERGEVERILAERKRAKA